MDLHPVQSILGLRISKRGHTVWKVLALQQVQEYWGQALAVCILGKPFQNGINTPAVKLSPIAHPMRTDHSDRQLP